jgi:molybdenum cofactor synthesis domain-containing protein
MAIRAGILTVSDKGSRGERADTSGAAIRELLGSVNAEVTKYAIVADESADIAQTLREWVDVGDIDLLVSTGGTGLAPRDVTPEATRSVLDYEVPGIGEAMRAEGLKHTPMSMLSRAVAGVRGRTLIVNLPGSERAVRQNLSVLLPILAHAVETLRGDAGDHVAGGPASQAGERP